MVCQGCLESKANIDELDRHGDFTGHEVCYLKGELINQEDSTIEKYVIRIEKLYDRVVSLEEELLQIQQEIESKSGDFVD
ncbi:hypothetical protein LCGC14_1461900 [marine sediment metagenome]|uniref:Uncharacterized protein n=1 Tax=marine sediment metagenome TaxID=412755 RepID=A0A0F9LVH0_9ZZZZ